MKRIILLIIITILVSQLYSQDSSFLRKIIFLDKEFDLIVDTSGTSIQISDYFPPTNTRFVFVEFAIDSQKLSQSSLSFSLSLYSRASDDTIPFEICDTFFCENEKVIMRGYCAIRDRDIPGGRALLLKDVINDFDNLEEAMKKAFTILYYNKQTSLYTNIDPHQIDVISPRLTSEEKFRFHKCYCPIRNIIFKIIDN